MSDLTGVNVLLDDGNSLQPHNDEDTDAQLEDDGERELTGDGKEDDGERELTGDGQEDDEPQRTSDDGKGNQTDADKNNLQEENDEKEDDLQAAADDDQQADDKVTEQRVCGLCDPPVPAAATNCFCVQCSVFLCRRCEQTHKENPTRREHIITVGASSASKSRILQTCERCAPEGRITFRAINIEQFQLRDAHRSHQVLIRNVPWNIIIGRKRCDDGDYLTCAIGCDRNKTLPPSFRIRASFSLRMTHPTSEQLTKEKKYTHTFTKSGGLFAIWKFHPWQGLVDDEFISEGAVTVEASIKVLETTHSLPCPDC